MIIYPQNINSELFAPYGEVIENKSNQLKQYFSVPFTAIGTELEFILSVNRLEPNIEKHIDIDLMERHPHSAQTFIPLNSSRYLLVVAQPDSHGGLVLSTLKAFIVLPGQGVSYRPSIWHYAFASLDRQAEIAVVVGKSKKYVDTEYIELEGIRVIL